MEGDGNGWVVCSLGHRHWGRFGAAGLLVGDAGRVLLQLRSPRTHDGGTWAVPGGARDSDETALTGALREVGEETTLDVGQVVPVAEYVDDHGGWSYTTVVARFAEDAGHQARAVEAANWESTELQWWTPDDVEDLPLHRGFAATWPQVSRLVPLGD